ncbi:hypothetical protein LTR72_000415 [Exophiala xenobiotica]|nr:hypothetical protein LTR92_003128 [Exophiala xenobiotica]KAK5231235.1 hypothetical protein LTR72_000415 [Exophiala xenobiotica]KAK5299749.1 hypothetical protein LTR14_001963 [Exophiala xenobiotica]KAK5499409.1 hypothetical protein LTR55_000232 [Exophiala xenobiotica]
MTPAFGFSVGDFIAAIELCAKVAKALKNSGAAAADYQQTVLELQGLQNILTRLAALEPTESNIQHVNAIRGAALASTLSVREFLTRLEKFEHSMSPFAAKKTVTLSRARRQTQYALFMADEVKKIRAVIYGNVLRINVLLATHASETLSRTEDHLATHHQDLVGRFQNLSDETAELVTGIANLKAEATTYHDAARQTSSRSEDQMQELSNKVEVNTATLTQGLANLSAGFGSVTTSVAVIRDLSYQVLSLLRTIPAELGSLIQNVLRSNARIESTLLSMNQKIAARPSLSLETNIHLEDALGRIHADIPFEWFRYWETFEGLLKARFKNTPGRQKIENGEFSLVHAKRTSISLDKDSWSGTITPGAHIVMLMLITKITFRNFACPRRSCTGQVVSEAGTADLAVCPKCDLRFIQQMTHVGSDNADEVARVQSIEDAQLFGARLGDDRAEDSDLSRRILDVAEDIEMMDVADDGRPNRWESREPRVDGPHPILIDQSTDIEHANTASLTSSDMAEPPIMSWLAQTVPPKNPESVREWREATETKQVELEEREAKDLEVFRNVQIVMPAEVAAPGLDEPSAVHSEDHDLDVGARIFYRNILDRYPHIDRPLARRLAIGNWHRQKRLTAQQAEVEPARIRADSRNIAQASQQDTAMGHSKRQVKHVGAKADDWEDVEHEQRAWSAMDSHRLTEHGTDNVHPTFGHGYDSLPSCSSLVRPIRATAPSFPSPQHQQSDMHAASWTPTPDIRQERTYGNYDFSPNIHGTKERRFCSLPPLPLPLPVTSTTSTSMKCYLCHCQVHILNKQS